MFLDANNSNSSLIIAAQDTEIESEYVIAEQVHRRERLIGHHFLMETREEVTRHSHVGLTSLSLLSII